MVKVITGAKFLENIKPPKKGREPYNVKEVGGMRLSVSSTGAMTWQLWDRFNGKYIPFKLGQFSDSERGLSLAAACDKARDWKRRIRAGDDPRIEANAERDRRDDTFAVVRVRFINQYVKKNLKPNTVKAYESVLNGSRFKGWEDKPVNTITRGDVIALIDGIADSGLDVMANRTLAYLKKFFRWCLQKDILKEGEPVPTYLVERPLKKESPRDRYLDEAEIKLLWNVAGELGYPYGPVYRLFLVTGQRQTECSRLKWSDINGTQWVQKDNKADREQIVPLNSYALEILDDCPHVGEYVFTTRGDRPINGFSKSKARLNKKLAEKATQGEYAEPWVIHDLRRTMTTHLREAGVSRDMCSLLLNHAEKGVTAETYDKYDQLPEKTQAMSAWASLINEFIHGNPDNVVRLKQV